MSLTGPTATEIKGFRAKVAMTQSDLAEALGIGRRTVEEWEAGRNPAPPMLRLALAAINGNLEPWSYLGMPPRGRITRKA